MAVTLAVGTALDIVLWLGPEKTVLSGRVVTSHPQFGNGIEFTLFSGDSQHRLQDFLEFADTESTRYPVRHADVE
jgi:hypothetical protein